MHPSPITILEQVADVLNALHCGVVLLDRGGRIVHANPRLGELMGRRATEMVGRHWPDLYADADEGERVAQILSDFLGAVDAETFLPLADGGRRAVAMTAKSWPGHPDFVLVTVNDISDVKAAQERQREQFQEMTRLSDTVLEQALELKHYSEQLEQRVRERTAELDQANLDAIRMLAVASEAKDADTGAHVLRIRNYTIALSRAIGLDDATAEQYGAASVLHDVGKLHVPDEILKKPGPLTDMERRRMESHTIVGERILAKTPAFDVARLIARSHHENWDGSGYPDGLRGRDIPLPARIVRLVDVYDALATQRPYKGAWSEQDVMQSIRDGAGVAFDPELAATFLDLQASNEWRTVGDGV